nr:MAG TPA: hypothetical protein [Bacteriophage sp.]
METECGFLLEQICLNHYQQKCDQIYLNLNKVR